MAVKSRLPGELTVTIVRPQIASQWGGGLRASSFLFYIEEYLYRFA